MKGHIFEFDEGIQKDGYNNTLKEISKYVVNNYDCGADISVTIEISNRVNMDQPPDVRKTATNTERNIWHCMDEKSDQ